MVKAACLDCLPTVVLASVEAELTRLGARRDVPLPYFLVDGALRIVVNPADACSSSLVLAKN